MPTIVSFANGALKFNIYARDHDPPHVHAEGGATIRIDLLTFEPLDDRTAFSRTSVRRITELVKQYREVLMEAWNELHGQV
jgi:Domain of unknown function (DUF4160)